MNWTFRIQHKFKTAVLFTVVVLLIISSSFLESRYMSQLNNSVSSIYKDRLIPEVELFHINDNMHSRRLILEKYIITPGNYDAAEIATQLNLHQIRIDSIVKNYETTYLVKEESEMLAQFKTTVHQYNNLERSLLSTPEDKITPESYQKELEPVFARVHSELLVLSNIQTSVGKELYTGSAITKGSANLITYLQIAIVVVITLAVQALLLNSKPILPKKMQNYNWN